MTPELERRIRETIGRKEQTILFLNHRAYSPFLMCRDCGFQWNVRTARLASASIGRIIGCDATIAATPPARQSRAQSVVASGLSSPFGAGTEKVEELVTEMFPDATVARLDRDIARKKGALEDILARFRSGDIDILVGTQMVAKGLDFPNVTLVGVIAADVSLNIPDFRSSERTYQLLSTSPGRSGRGS